MSDKTEKEVREFYKSEDPDSSNKYDASDIDSWLFNKEDMIKFATNFATSQPLNLDVKVDDELNPVDFSECETCACHDNKPCEKRAREARTIRERLEQVSQLTIMNTNLIEINDKKNVKVDELTKERDELKEVVNLWEDYYINTNKEHPHTKQLQVEKDRVKELEVEREEVDKRLLIILSKVNTQSKKIDEINKLLKTK